MLQWNRPSNKILLYFLALVLVAIYSTLVCKCAFSTSATYDEQVYGLAGYSYLRTGEFWAKRDSTPLVPLAGGLSISLYGSIVGDIRLDEDILSELPQVRESWINKSIASQNEYTLASKFFHQNSGPVTIRWLRLPAIGAGIAMGLLVFAFTKRLAGIGAGITGLFFFSLNPCMVGYSAVLAADMPLGLGLVSSVFFLRNLVHKPTSAYSLFGLVASVVFAVCVKLSGVLVFPVLGISALLWLIFPENGVVETHGGIRSYRKAILWRGFIAISLIIPACGVSICFLYGSWQGLGQYFQSFGVIYSNLPWPYESFFLGQYDEKFYCYYPVAIFLKSPVGFTFLSILALAAAACKKDRQLLIFLAVPIAVILFVSAFDKVNIGVRRILPVYPFCFVLIGSLASLASKSGFRFALSAILVSAAMEVAVDSYWNTPFQLSYFNRLVGGGRNGLRYLGESNVSWGQNLPALRKFQDDNPELGTIHFHYYGTDTREDYGIRYQPFDGFEISHPCQTVYALSAHSILVYGNTNAPGANWLERFEPFAVIGNTIFLFDLRKFPSDFNIAPDKSLDIGRKLAKSDKPLEAIIYFQAYLKSSEDPAVCLELAELANSNGHKVMGEFYERLALEWQR